MNTRDNQRCSSIGNVLMQVAGVPPAMGIAGRSVEWLLVGLFLLSLVASEAGCMGSANTATRVDLLRVGVLPGQDPEQLRSRYTALFEYISEETGVSLELVVPDSYSHLLELFDKGEIDLCYFGGLTFLKAHRNSRAVPLVMRDEDMRFTSYFLVHANSPVKYLEDCKGMRCSFGPKLSTSGHLMPRYFMEQRERIPETFFSEVRYSGAHDRTALDVRDGVVDVGVANAEIVDAMYESGRLDRAKVRVLWKTPPYPDYVWAVQPHMPVSLQRRVLEAFLKLSMDDPNHALILDRLGAQMFIPASVDDFTRLRTIAKKYGMFKESP